MKFANIAMSLASFALIASAALVAAPASADITVNTSNKNTGNRSRNINRVNISVSENHDDHDGHSCNRRCRRHGNKTKIENKIKVRANTGHNKQKKNTKGGNLNSGDINITLDILN